MEIAGVQRNAQKLTSTLEAFYKRCSAMDEVMKWKKDEALKKVEGDVKQLKRRLDEILMETEHKVESDVGAIVERLKDADLFVTRSLNELKETRNELQRATGGDGEAAVVTRMELLQGRLEIGTEEQCNKPITSHVNFGVVENSRFNSVLSSLRSGRLHYLKRGPNLPNDLRFSLVPLQNCSVGHEISLEVRLPRSDPDCLEALKVQVRNETHNVSLESKLGRKQTNSADVFVLTFLAELEGRHVVEAFLYDEPIANSPLTLLIENSSSVGRQTAPLFDLSSFSSAPNSFNFDRPMLSQTAPVFAAPTFSRTLQSLRRQAPSADRLNSSAAERNSVPSWEMGANRGVELETSQVGQTGSLERKSKGLARESDTKTNLVEEKSTVVAFCGYGRGAPLSRSIEHQRAGSTASKGEASASNVGMASVKSALESVEGEENWDDELSSADTAKLASSVGDSVTPESTKDAGKMEEKRWDDGDRRRRVCEASSSQNLHFSSADFGDSGRIDAVKTSSTGFLAQKKLWDHERRTSVGDSASSQNLQFDANSASGLPNLVDMFNKSGGKGLYGRLVNVFGVPGKGDQPSDLGNVEDYFLRPIGCSRSEHTADWIVCDTDHNIVKLFDAKFEPNLLIKHASGGHTPFVRPSAVATFDGSKKMLIKDDRRIAAFELVGEDAGVVLGQLTENSKMMGLAVTEGKAVTLMDAFLGKGAEIHVYDIENSVGGGNCRPLCRFQYGNICGGDSKPRFIDVQRDRLIVTDLGQNKVSTISLRDGQLIGQFGKQGRRPGEFNFVSGVRLDGAGNLLIGDAKNNRIQLFDSDGRFVCVLTLDQPGAGFVSDLHLTPDGHVMVCNRGQNYCAVFKLASSPV